MRLNLIFRFNRLILTIIVVHTLHFSTNVYAQDNSIAIDKSHTLSFKTQFVQIKDEFNYGLTFNGPLLVLGYSLSKITETTVLKYSPVIAFGGVFNKGAGFAWRFKPIDVFYGRNIKSKPISIGGYFTTDYQWQQYSELQGGRLFWFSALEIGPFISIKFPYKSYFVNITFSNSLVGLTSRPEPSTESYFYSFSFSEFISVSNQNMQIGSLNHFNRTKFGVEIRRKAWQRFSMGYNFEYFGYYQEPGIDYINHSLNLNWKIKST